MKSEILDFEDVDMIESSVKLDIFSNIFIVEFRNRADWEGRG